jgi:urea carboxylase
VEACERAGLVFLGPTPAQMRALGLKHTAREIAEREGAPLLTGTGLLIDETHALAEAERCGYPVILKSTAGGGGIGMRVCRTAAELTQHFGAVARLGAANFGQGGVYLERFVERARHIEVQIFGDGAGHVVALGEARLLGAAAQSEGSGGDARAGAERRRAPAAVGHGRDAGACRAIPLGRHGGVSLRLGPSGLLLPGSEHALAGGARRHGRSDRRRHRGVDGAPRRRHLPPLDTLRVTPSGASIQVRVYAEDPAHDFRPSTGLLTDVRLPPGVRCDTWVERGTEVTPYYDPMLAKIIVRGATRAEAMARLETALAEASFAGLETNLDYLRQIVTEPEFRAGGFPPAS